MVKIIRVVGRFFLEIFMDLFRLYLPFVLNSLKHLQMGLPESPKHQGGPRKLLLSDPLASFGGVILSVAGTKWGFPES